MNNFIVKPNKSIKELIDIANKPVLYNHYKGEIIKDERIENALNKDYSKGFIFSLGRW